MTKRVCPKCRCEQFDPVWWAGAEGRPLRAPVGKLEDTADYLFQCRACHSMWTPSCVLADSTRWLVYTRSLQLGLQIKPSERVKLTYGGAWVEAHEEGGYWYAEALGFDSIVSPTRAVTRELAALGVKKKVERWVAYQYEKLTDEDWIFEDDLLDELRFVQGKEQTETQTEIAF